MKHNFYAGPSIIAKEVLQEAANNLIDYQNTGLSIIEISHRSKTFGKVIEEARLLVKEIAGLSDDYEVLFLQGGGRQQFYQIPFNLLNMFEVACYVDTGQWAHQAMKEAAFFGKTQVVATSEDAGYNHIPKQFTIPPKAAYLHITTNNTIYGTQYHYMPQISTPLVADMSSDIFSRKLNYNQFDLIYAAAQKNAGTAGATLVIVRKSLLAKELNNIPAMVDYRSHINKNSLYNTPPSFAIYLSLLVLKWIKKCGGLAYFDELNRRKATLLYDEIDRNPLFVGRAVIEDRSNMNVVYHLVEKYNQLEATFLKMCYDADIVGIKGYRTLGGFRASLYNALSFKSVQVLVDVMQEFERKFG